MKVILRILSFIFDPVDHSVSGVSSQKSSNFFTRYSFVVALIAVLITAAIFAICYLVI